MFVLRGHALVPVPPNYRADPAHRAIVDLLQTASTYMNAVVTLEVHAASWLGADILSGARWAQRFLLSTAALSQSAEPRERALAKRGLRALLMVLTGTKPHVGRKPHPPLTNGALQRAASAVTVWRGYVEAYWGQEPAVAARALLAQSSFPLSRAHGLALRELLRRPRVRKQDVVLALVSWETGISLRRLRRSAAPQAELIYR